MTTQQTKLFAALMEIDQKPCEWKPCDECGYALWCPRTHWSPSPDGTRISYEVIDFMAEKLPEAWEEYLRDSYAASLFKRTTEALFTINMPSIFSKKHDEIPFEQIFTDRFNAQLSLSNLAEYIIAHTEMFYECPACAKYGKWPTFEFDDIEYTCCTCNDTGRTIEPEFEAVVKFIESLKEGK